MFCFVMNPDDGCSILLWMMIVLFFDESWSMFYFVPEQDEPRSRTQIIKIKEGLSKLPPAHYQTLRFLLAHLNRFLNYSPNDYYRLYLQSFK